MTSQWEILMARAVAGEAKDAPGGGMHRYELCRRLKISGAELRKFGGLAYAWGMIDYCGPYIVVPSAKMRRR